LPILLSIHVEKNIDVHVIIMLLECYDDFDDYMVVHLKTPPDWSSDYASKILKPQKGLWKPMGKDFFASDKNMKFNMPLHDNGVITSLRIVTLTSPETAFILNLI